MIYGIALALLKVWRKKRKSDRKTYVSFIGGIEVDSSRRLSLFGKLHLGTSVGIIWIEILNWTLTIHKVIILVLSTSLIALALRFSKEILFDLNHFNSYNIVENLNRKLLLSLELLSYFFLLHKFTLYLLLKRKKSLLTRLVVGS